MSKIKNPYTKDKGYVFARHDPFAGWFVVYKMTDEPYGWRVESKQTGQSIPTKTRGEAEGIAALAVDGVGLNKWNYELRLRGIIPA